MELLCGVPRTPKNPWPNYGASLGPKGDRLCRSSSFRVSALSSVTPSTKRASLSPGGSVRSTRSAGVTTTHYGVTGRSPLDSSRPRSINKHLIPVSGSLPPVGITHDSYSKPMRLTVVDSYREYDSGTPSPLRRSQTLPPLAIRRGGLASQRMKVEGPYDLSECEEEDEENDSDLSPVTDLPPPFVKEEWEESTSQSLAPPKQEALYQGSAKCSTEEALYSSPSEASMASFSTASFTDEGVYSSSSNYSASICSDRPSLPSRKDRSVRSFRQLPVTPSLKKLLQMGLDSAPSLPPPNTFPPPHSSLHSHVLPPPSKRTHSPLPSNPPGGSDSTSGVVRREKLHPPRTDAHRFSRANLEDSGDLELDAILGELCILGTQFDQELQKRTSADNSGTIGKNVPLQVPTPPKMCSRMSISSTTQSLRDSTCSSTGGKSNLDSTDTNCSSINSIARTDSPDNDSAFSDSLSVLSSGSSASSGASHNLRHAGNNQTDTAAQVKAEKIKLALEKIKEANVKKLFLKAFSRDGSSKSLLVDEKMSVVHVTRLLADKNHVRMEPKWTIVEHYPDLFMERIYEDDEMLVDNLLLWARDSKNRLIFLDRPEKYHLFWQPEHYLSPPGEGGKTTIEGPLDDEARNNMIEELFSSGSVPEVEGPLFLKSEGKKAWKKFYFVLRASGLYYCPKGKSSRSSKDLVCLVTFDSNQVYQGFGWRKKHKAPSDWGFALKPPALQAKSSKYIKYLCTEDSTTMQRWMTAIRIAKCGPKLLHNYRSLVEDLAQEDIDLLESSRSFSLASVAGQSSIPSMATTPSSESRSLDSCLASSVASEDCEESDEDGGDTPVNTLNRSSGQQAWGDASLFNTLSSTTSSTSSSSSGCLSHRSNASTPSTEHGFESEFSQQGTIKRKPPTTAKIPLTSTTRHMLHQGEEGGSLRLRRSIGGDDSSCSSNTSTLKRRNSSNNTLPRGMSATKTLPPMAAPPSTSAEVDGLMDTSLLPPPPPELMSSTLSLASSLPPPPEDITPPDEDEMTCSMISLPPPPPPLMSSPTRQNAPLPPPFSAKPNSPPPPPVAPKPRRPSGSLSPTHHPSPPRSLPIKSSLIQSSSLPPKKKKISFNEDVQSIPHYAHPASLSPPSPSSPSKPPPPPRAESTRLSILPQQLPPPNKLTPPKSFLCNLQRVMEKKWQVAEKCKDVDRNPHEVLGFRDSLPPTETEKNVGRWIQEHYGCLYDHLGDSPNSPGESLPSPPLPSPPPMSPPPTAGFQRPISSMSRQSSISCHSTSSRTSTGSRKVPPPPPKRADSTHLSFPQ